MFINTRRFHATPVVLTIGTVLALTACGGEPADGSASDPSTRTVVDATGEVEIPTEPTRILAVDEYAAVTMLTVGAVPDLTYLVFNDPLSPLVLDHLGAETRVEAGFIAEPNFETIASDAPDLIVTSDAGPLAGRIDELSRIAPTVSLSFGEGWRDSVQQAAAIFGTDPTAIEAGVDARVEEVAGSLDGRSVSLLLDYGMGLSTPTPDSPMALLLEEVGAERPADQAAEQAATAEFVVPLSAERLPEQDADLVALLDGGSYDAEAVRAQPLFGRLQGTAYDVDGTAWFGNSAYNMWWVLDDLEAMAAGEQPSPPEAATTMWDEYAAGTGDE